MDARRGFVKLGLFIAGSLLMLLGFVELVGYDVTPISYPLWFVVMIMVGVILFTASGIPPRYWEESSDSNTKEV